MTKTQCFIKKSKEGANDILEGFSSLKDYGNIVIRIILSVVILLLVTLPLLIYIMILAILDPGNVIYALGLLIIFAFLEIVWVKCIAFPLISCMDSDKDV